MMNSLTPSLARTLPIPGALLGPYPERAEPEHSLLERALQALPRMGRRAAARGAMAKLEKRVRALSYRTLIEPQFAALAQDCRANLRRHGLTDTLIVQAFALVDEALARERGVRLYATQFLAARIMLGNRLAEMATGEGKSYAAMLCAAVAAMAGIPVHLMTANDYLVERDAGAMAPVLARLGLTAAHVVAPMDEAARRAAYRADIVYCTAREVVFDYLRDRTGRPAGAAGEPAQPVLRGLCMAVIDEADAILLDEARTPFVLSAPVSEPEQHAQRQLALALARKLEPRRDFLVDPARRAVRVTATGQQRIDAMTTLTGQTLWLDSRVRDELLNLALAALHVFRRDRDYLVRDDALVMIDAVNGRVAEGRVWSRGLQQLLEIKEGVRVTEQRVTAAQITYQRFFPRYWRLCGMSGTLAEARAELRHSYAVPIESVPLRTACARVVWPTRLFADSAQRWQAVVASVERLHRAGRPVLIGTDSVADSDALSALLGAAGLPHTVLNARQDQAEAQIIAAAGQVGAITVSTNMAGRGTDIELSARARAAGGLHVIACQHNRSARIDRQLIGRCARQGDPGSAQTMLALDAGLFNVSGSRGLHRAIRASYPLLPGVLHRAIARWPQRLEEFRERRERSRLRRSDQQLARSLAFSGKGE